jgi:hypothetical protein
MGAVVVGVSVCVGFEGMVSFYERIYGTTMFGSMGILDCLTAVARHLANSRHGQCQATLQG